MTTALPDLPELPKGVRLSFGGFCVAAEALEHHDVVCALKQRGQQSGIVQLLAGDRETVLTFARRCRSALGMTVITNARGLR